MKDNVIENKILCELVTLYETENFSQVSTENLRSIVFQMCIESGQRTETFDDRRQHDAGEFLLSLVEHSFRNTLAYNNFDEIMFGGLVKETFVCSCGEIKERPIERLSEVLVIPITRDSVQSCLEDYFEYEAINKECEGCKSSKMKKRVNIEVEPSTLIIQLNRYSYCPQQKKTKKRLDNIKSSETIKLPSGGSYNLVSTVNHIGSHPNEGHYNVFMHEEPGSVVLIDDLQISTYKNISSEMNSLSYILFYNKC